MYWSTNSGIVKRLKPCKRLIFKAWLSRAVGEQGRPCYGQQPLESAKRWCINNDIWKTIPRAEKPNGVDHFPRGCIFMSYPRRFHSTGALKNSVCGKSRLGENVVSSDEVSTKTASLERKHLADETVLYVTGSLCCWPYVSQGAVCAPSKICPIKGMVTTPAGRTHLS